MLDILNTVTKQEFHFTDSPQLNEFFVYVHFFRSFHLSKLSGEVVLNFVGVKHKSFVYEYTRVRNNKTDGN